MNRNKVTKICNAMSDPNRLHIIELLTNGEKCACELLRELQITQPTLSHHMKLLCNCGLVTAIKVGKWNHYHLNFNTFNEYKEYISEIFFLEKKSS